jgi:hypothetical protein
VVGGQPEQLAGTRQSHQLRHAARHVHEHERDAFVLELPASADQAVDAARVDEGHRSEVDQQAVQPTAGCEAADGVEHVRSDAQIDVACETDGPVSDRNSERVVH